MKFNHAAFLLLATLASGAAADHAEHHSLPDSEAMSTGFCLSKHLEHKFCTGPSVADDIMEGITFCLTENMVEAAASLDVEVQTLMSVAFSTPTTAEEAVLKMTLFRKMATCIASSVGFCNRDNKGCLEIVSNHDALLSEMNSYAASYNNNGPFDPSQTVMTCTQESNSVNKTRVWEMLFDREWCESDWEAAPEDENMSHPVMRPEDITSDMVDQARVVTFLNCVQDTFDHVCDQYVEQLLLAELEHSH